VNGTAARYDYLWTFNLPLIGMAIDQSPEAAQASDHRPAIVAVARRDGLTCPPSRGATPKRGLPMLPPTTPIAGPQRERPTSLSVTSEADGERLAAFNAQIHGDSVENMTRNLILRHPASRPKHWLFIDDEAGRVTSSLCLIPWTWRYGSVTLRSGELGIVGTLPDYRHGKRSLIAVLMERFNELLDECEYDLSHIQGIPYYYRRYGYDYA